MSWKYNPFTKKLDQTKTTSELDSRYVNETDYFYRGVLAAAPLDPEQGWVYIDSTDNKIYIYYGSTWQVLHTLSLAMNYLLLEGGDKLLLEDGVSKLALES